MPRWFAALRHVCHLTATLIVALAIGAAVLAFALVATGALVGIRPQAMPLAVLFGSIIVVVFFVPGIMRGCLTLNPPPACPRLVLRPFTWLEQLRRQRLLRQLRRLRRRGRVDGRLDRIGSKLRDVRTRSALRMPGTMQSLVSVAPDDIATVLTIPARTQHYHLVLDRCAPSARGSLLLDAASLSPAARLLFLGALIGAGDSRRPDRLATYDAGTHRLTYQSAARAIDADHWRKAAPTIAALLGRSYAVRERDGLSLDLEPLAHLPSRIPLRTVDLDIDRLLLGYDLVTGRPHAVPLRYLTHTLVAGPSGMGKSTFAHLLIWQLVHHAEACAELILVDLKDGLEFARFANVAPTISVVDTVTDLAATLTRLELTMAERLALLKRAGRVAWQGQPIIILVDEFAHIALHPGSERKAILEAFTRIGNQARAAGIHLILQVQHAVADTLPTALRRNLIAVVSFRQPSAQAAAALFGDTQDFPADITRLRPGQFIYRSGRTAETFALQAPAPPLLTQRGAP